MKRLFLVLCLVALIFPIGCGMSQDKQQAQRATEEFEKWQAPRVEQNIRMGYAPNYKIELDMGFFYYEQKD